MHTVHVASAVSNGFQYAAMGIMWSVNDATIELDEKQQKIVDAFFDSLKWDETSVDPKVAEVPYGDLMMMVNTRDRWVYKGSVTTPPCAQYVYWNVLRTIYPVKQSVIDQFKKQQARTPGLEGWGNWREIQELNDQNPKIIQGADGDINFIVLILMIVFFLTTLCFCIGSISCYNKAVKAADSSERSATAPGEKDVEMV